MKKLLFVILFACSTLSAVADIDVLVWRNSKTSPPFLIPKRQSETKKQAVDRYFHTMQSDTKMKEMLRRDNFLDFIKDGKILYNSDQIDSLISLKKKNIPFFLLSTNSIENLFRSPPAYFNLEGIVNKFHTLGAQAFVLPPVHDLSLSKVEREIFRNKLIEASDALFILGGDDLDPYLYGEPVIHAQDLNRRRDLSEMRFVKNYAENKDKGLFGVCRGHQLCAVTTRDLSLTQDINIELGAPKGHLNQNHSIHLPEGSFLRNIFKKEEIEVNSFHHMQVDASTIKPGAGVKVAAVSTDGYKITEALEFTDRPGFTFQFHPEIMNNDVGDKIMKEVIKVTKKTKLESSNCLDLIKNFL